MVCVMRTDLRNTDGHKLPKGKLIAQGGHAYTALLLNLLKEDPKALTENKMLRGWLEDSFVKICLAAESLEELRDLYDDARARGLNAVWITDSGLTEFGGEETPTCIGIGPDDAGYIDLVTGHLKSL